MGGTVILDACCLLTLYATGHFEELLRQFPYCFRLGSRARRESLWLSIPGEEERESIDLQPWIDLQLLAEEWLNGPVEEALFVELGARIADEEAEAAALAAARGYVLATDDRKARRVVAARCSALRFTGTLALMREWQLATGYPDSVLAVALRRIADRASYHPRQSDPLWAWWAALVRE